MDAEVIVSELPAFARKLDEHLTKGGISNDAFGEQIGTTGEAVRKYREGERMPRDLIRPKIIQATKDSEHPIVPNDFLPEGVFNDS